MEEYQKWDLVIQGLLAIGAFVFGIAQTRINKRLKDLQDFVSIAIIPGNYEVDGQLLGHIKLINTGAINVYVCRYEIPGKFMNFTPPRMIPTNGGEVANYWLPVPNLSYVEENKNFDIVIYLIDQHGKKFILRGQGILNNGNYRFWANSTLQKDWKF